MVAICHGRFLIISPDPKDVEEKRAHFSSTRLNGVTLTDIYERPSTKKFKFEYASGDDEPVRHFPPGTDVESFFGRKRALFNDSDSGEDTCGKSNMSSTHFPSERDSAEPDSGRSSSSKSRISADRNN